MLLQTVDGNNKEAFFFALMFSNILTINTTLATDSLNIDALDDFLNTLKDEHPELFQYKYFYSQYLLDPDNYVIKADQADLNLFEDILRVCQPTYLIKENIVVYLSDGRLHVSGVPRKGKPSINRPMKDIFQTALLQLSRRNSLTQNEILRNNLFTEIEILSSNIHNLKVKKAS